MKSAGETILLFVSGKEKSGALVPSGNMVELVSAMWGVYEVREEMQRVKGRRCDA